MPPSPNGCLLLAYHGLERLLKQCNSNLVLIHQISMPDPVHPRFHALSHLLNITTDAFLLHAHQAA